MTFFQPLALYFLLSHKLCTPQSMCDTVHRRYTRKFFSSCVTFISPFHRINLAHLANYLVQRKEKNLLSSNHSIIRTSPYIIPRYNNNNTLVHIYNTTIHRSTICSTSDSLQLLMNCTYIHDNLSKNKMKPHILESRLQWIHISSLNPTNAFKIFPCVG